MIELEEFLDILNYDDNIIDVIIHEGDNRYNLDTDDLEEELSTRLITDINISVDDVGVVVSIFVEEE
ncbi:hypothetical protein SAMN04487839_11817 [Streptococcus gallolyticus]|uniref:Uncharacterized protein n=1 Tax=Streptococcus gallolyticus TaxID=315405 RepID=A0A1H7XR58_9STRE|nr:hypothetical protein [Streptococcus gallolyticus]SEF25507.1 hypothetical protein SAMN02910295_0142 [Streptococcus gallolyticus]SEM36326.1 hypothetical protein SAMN04487839_11817 [Streptococcus gallolyticus]